MAQAESLLQALSPEDGVICGFRLWRDAPAERIGLAGVEAALAAGDSVIWLHFNLGRARAKRWLAQAEFLPVAFRQALAEREDRCRLEAIGEGLLGVINDLVYSDGTETAEPGELASLWFYANHRLLVSARIEPLRSPDRLRLAVRSGATDDSGIGLAAQLIAMRTEALESLVDEMVEQVDEIEEEILIGGISEREGLGRIRRGCARLRRGCGPERNALIRLLKRAPAWLDANDRRILGEVVDDLGFLLADERELYERAKLLQEELAGRLAETTNRNLYVLSVLTAVFSPMTLITGIFGMNTSGLPFAGGDHGFWPVMLLVCGAGAGTFALLFLKRKF
ncbi:CorA family divalent cation transporter [Plasticicumulans acidivorans]|uniref:Zinc transporter n=1 Tax=Plasticicumulans acidivorans TaxID=886464 RepID=A0A317N5D9_9GAMM|nr:CorA family divalent cation transporter [Plasticicumulans acidivorans]PWV65969.1 zinc transporter [Plasticicumulans acidivorans]